MLSSLTKAQKKKTNPYLFEFILESFKQLDEGTDPDVITFIVQMKMLAVMGLYPELNHCVHCKSQDGTFHFSVRDNGFICHRCFDKDPYKVPIKPQTARLLRLFYYFDLSRIGNVSLKQETKNELKQVIDLYYEEYSGVYLKSKRFLDQMESMKHLMGENKS